MRDLIVSQLVTLDGVMEAPGGEPDHPFTGWAIPYMGEEEVASKEAEAQEAGALLLGRVTYESFAGAWPERDGPLADALNAMPKHLVSTTLDDPDWAGTSVIPSDVFGSIRRLKAAEGGPILVNGSRTLCQGLWANDLVDELRLMVFPVTVGVGARAFPEAEKMVSLSLANVRRFASGVVLLTYRRA